MRTLGLDHDVQSKSETNLRKYRLIQEFAETHGTFFYPAGYGIGHQVMIDEGEKHSQLPKNNGFMLTWLKVMLGQEHSALQVTRIRQFTVELDALELLLFAQTQLLFGLQEAPGFSIPLWPKSHSLAFFPLESQART